MLQEGHLPAGPILDWVNTRLVLALPANNGPPHSRVQDIVLPRAATDVAPTLCSRRGLAFLYSGGTSKPTVYRYLYCTVCIRRRRITMHNRGPSILQPHVGVFRNALAGKAGRYDIHSGSVESTS